MKVSYELYPFITTYLYITIQIFKLSAEEAIHDPVYHLLLRGQDKKGAASGSSLRLISAEVIFSALGCLMLGMLLYTILTYGSPFNKEILTP
ncbi:Triosephosphate isomerase [Bienertia sinuspersici]